jgi:hypothetical protein
MIGKRAALREIESALQAARLQPLAEYLHALELVKKISSCMHANSAEFQQLSHKEIEVCGCCMHKCVCAC